MSGKDHTPYVDTKVEAGIATITFFHPSHNALPGNLLERLVVALDQVAADTAVRVVILKSGGDRTFCAGASFDELLAIRDKDQGKRFFMGFASVINAMRRCPKLIIVRVQGKAVGGGVGIAAAADYCLATRYAAVRLSELAIGIGPFVIEPAVRRKIGLAAMAELTVSTNWRDAEWAAQKGLYAQVLEDQEKLDLEVDALARRLSSFHPAALEEMKAVFWKDTEDWDRILPARAATSGRLVLSAFTRKALEEFKGRA
ncbi:MAG TPA: enoyl-CoA hydratase/isomerase family protein [Saprospiraceae bacterium]|nr:enoyl-CoA hydratase/isomerase family protein [Saprospiraceae bacterium]